MYAVFTSTFLFYSLTIVCIILSLNDKNFLITLDSFKKNILWYFKLFLKFILIKNIIFLKSYRINERWNFSNFFFLSLLLMMINFSLFDFPLAMLHGIMGGSEIKVLNYSRFFSRLETIWWESFFGTNLVALNLIVGLNNIFAIYKMWHIF